VIDYIEEAIARLLEEKHNLQFVRSNEVDDIALKIKGMWSGVFLVEGLPGMGKSATMRYLAGVVGAHKPERVIPYYFSLNNSVLDNAGNFYAYACKKIKGLLDKNPERKKDSVHEGSRKDNIDFQNSLIGLGKSIGNDTEQRVYLFMDGIEEMREHKEFLSRLPHLEGVVYVVFAQPGVCEGALAKSFYEQGKIKNRAEIKFLDKDHAKMVFWEAYGRTQNSDKLTAFENIISDHLEKHIQIEANRYPLLLKVLAEDAREDGFNPDRAWAKGLEEYLDGRISALSENARNLLILVALAIGPLQCEDLCEMLGGVSKAVGENALKEARRFLTLKEQDILISHNVWATIISKRWASKSMCQVYLKWCSDWRKPNLRKSKAKYIAKYYILHLIRDAFIPGLGGSDASRQHWKEISEKEFTEEFMQFVKSTLDSDNSRASEVYFRLLRESLEAVLYDIEHLKGNSITPEN